MEHLKTFENWEGSRQEAEEGQEWNRVKELADEFIQSHGNPLDLITNGLVSEEFTFADYVVDWMEDKDAMTYFEPVIAEILKREPDFGELWKEF